MGVGSRSSRVGVGLEIRGWGLEMREGERLEITLEGYPRGWWFWKIALVVDLLCRANHVDCGL